MDLRQDSRRDLYSANSRASSDLTSFIKVDSLLSTKKKFHSNAKQIVSGDRDYQKNKFYNDKKCNELISSISYLPKNRIKFTPLNLMSYPSPNKFSIGNKHNSRSDKIEDSLMPFQIGNKNETSSNGTNYMMSGSENEFLTFKTNFILKFAKNVEVYDKVNKYLDIISDSNKKNIFDYFRRIRTCTDKKDQILFDSMNYNILTENNKNNESNSNKANSNYKHWKECTILFYEFEVFWLKLSDIILKELKSAKDSNILLAKKNSDQTNIISQREKEVSELNELIETHDIYNKTQKAKKKNSELNEIKEEYNRKDKINVFNVYRLEEEIKDLTALLDKHKEFYFKFLEAQESIESKKKEMEEMRVKFNMDLEEKKLKIAYLNNEKYEIDVKNKSIEKEIEELKKIFDNSKKEYIEFHTQIKILKQTLEEKRENIEMLTEEVDIWRNDYEREVHYHSYTQQTVTALEIKIQTLQKDKQKSILNI